MFTIDYSQAKEFGSIKDGTYEVTIDLAKQDATQGGADYLDIRFRIRKDFQQEFQNNIIFYRIFAKKDDGKYPVASILLKLQEFLMVLNLVAWKIISTSWKEKLLKLPLKTKNLSGKVKPTKI